MQYFLDANQRVYVYWIHLTEHDIHDGYIGVSIDPKRRLDEHSRRNKTIKKNFDSILMDIIFCGDEESCYLLEAELRPNTRIGWNVARGGCRSMRDSLTGIKKSKPVWNKGKSPSAESLEKFKHSWSKKTSSGYISPNRENSKGNLNKKGKRTGKMHQNTHAGLLSANVGHTRNRNLTIWTFVHADGRIESCTTYDLRTRYNLPQGGLSNMINGRRKSCGGWKILENID